MQPGRARTRGLGVPPLLLARWVGWVAPVCPTHGVLVLSCSSAALRVHVCAVSWATWLVFTGVPAWCVAVLVRCPGPLGSCSPVCPLGVLFCLCGVLGHLAPVHRCAARRVVLRVRCPGAHGSCSRVCPLCVLCGVCCVLGHLAPVYRCACLVRCFACAVSWATWLLFTSVPAWCVALLVRCPGPLGSCSPVCPLGVLFCLCGVLGHLAFVHQCARSVRSPCVRCLGPPGSCSPLCLLGALFCLCGVLGYLTPVHRCARSACCVACAVSWATWLLFTVVPARRVVLCVRCPGPVSSCSPVCSLCVLCGVCGVLGHLAPVQRCTRSVRFLVCAVSWATWLLFTGVPLSVLPGCAVSWATWLLLTNVPARCVVLLVRCPWLLGSCSPVCPLGPLLCVCGVLGHVAPVHRCARSVCCFSCAVSWATWLLFTGVPARRVACVCGVSGHLAPVLRSARLVRCFACAVSWVTWLLFTGVPARRVVLRVRCPGPLGSCSPVCLVGVLCCVCGVLGPLALVHWCAHPECSAVSWATWLLFTGVRARCVVLWVACVGRRCGALTRPSGRWLFVASRGWVPSRRALVRPDGGRS